MRKIKIFSMISLDGVIQAPGAADEDRSGNFKYGGWTQPYSDDVYHSIVQKELEPADYLLGRKTFEIWEDYWPNHSDFWPGINEGQKYVLSNTRLTTDWKNTTFITNLEEIKDLKSSTGMDLHVWGSSELVKLLLANDLVDEISLKIHPLFLGKGKKLFNGSAVPRSYTMVEHIVTYKGVVIAKFINEGPVKTKDVEL